MLTHPGPAPETPERVTPEYIEALRAWFNAAQAYQSQQLREIIHYALSGPFHDECRRKGIPCTCDEE